MYFYHGYALGVASTRQGDVFTKGTCALSLCGGEDSRSVKASDPPTSPLVSFDSIESSVSGKELHPFGEDCLDVYQTEASVVIKNLKIKDATGKERITAASVTARILSQHRAGDYEPSTVICGSGFDTLKVDEQEIKPVWLKALSQRYATYSAMQTDFQNDFSRQTECDCLLGHDLNAGNATTEDLKAAYDSFQQQIKLTSLKSVVICSSVQKVEGIKAWGPIIPIPNLGNLYLGDLMVWSWMRCLTMFRLELLDKDNNSIGCITGASVGANGSTIPPGGHPPLDGP